MVVEMLLKRRTTSAASAASRRAAPPRRSAFRCEARHCLARTTQAGGSGAGLIITPYCEIEEDTGYHFFARVKLTFDQSGALVSAEALPGRKLIQA